MDIIKVIIDGLQKDVYGIFYIFNSKYYLIYTEKEVDDNGYVVLYMSQIGKETKNTPAGPIETGYMVGVEVSDPEEQKKSQESVSYIVEDKKNNTANSQIQYLPMSMLTNLKIVSKKRFRLLKSIMIENFKLTFENSEVGSKIIDDIAPIQSLEPVVPEITPVVEPAPVVPEIIPVVEPAPVVPEITPVVESAPVVPEMAPVAETSTTNLENSDAKVIIDYRTKYFEEEEKNQELQSKIDELTRKLEEIKKVIE